LAQERFSDDTLRQWERASNGHACETKLFGDYRGRSFVYPPDALRNGVSGDVLLTLDTQVAGVFDDTALIVASNFVFPEGMRNCESLRARLQFRVYDGNRDGVMSGIVISSAPVPPLNAAAVDILRSRRVGAYCGVASGPINQAELSEALSSFYPPIALSRDESGMAVVRFSIAPDGSVVAPTVVDEMPTGRGFGEAAVRGQQVARYSPRAETCEDAATIVHFRPQ
jgi:TonB family protein